MNNHYDIKNFSSADQGRECIEWTLTERLVLRAAHDRFTDGRRVNLAAVEGHSATVMDTSFANQALSIAYLWRHGVDLENAVHPAPTDIDQQAAMMKLAAMRLSIDSLSTEQQTS